MFGKHKKYTKKLSVGWTNISSSFLYSDELIEFFYDAKILIVYHENGSRIVICVANIL